MFKLTLEADGESNSVTIVKIVKLFSMVAVLVALFNCIL